MGSVQSLVGERSKIVLKKMQKAMLTFYVESTKN